MRFLTVFLIFLSANLANAQVSDLIRTQGLAATEALLLARSDLTADEKFALSGVIFLGAVERGLQERWRLGDVSGFIPLPVFRLPLPANPDAEPFAADTVRTIFTRFATDMTRADDILASIPADADPVMEIALRDLWFDINADGSRQDGETFASIAAPAFLTRWQIDRAERNRAENPDAPDPLSATIRFDTADVAWLRAYTQVLAGASQLILAFDPTEPFATVLATQQTYRNQDADYLAQFPDRAADLYRLRGEEEIIQIVDVASIIIETMRNDPDPKRIRAAQGHFLNMVAHNRVFWATLELETDNENEWIPNATQTAALGIEVPDGLGKAWQAVLDDAEAVLTGEKLAPFWRFAPTYGVNIQAYVDDPAPIPIVQWIQGATAIPYAEKGTVLTDQSWSDFERLVQGSGLFVFLLN